MLNRRKSWLPTVLLLSLLTACSTQPSVKTPTVTGHFLETAGARVAVGDHEGAVDYYLRAAAVAGEEDRQGILLQAAASLMALDKVDRAVSVLDSLVLSFLTSRQRQHYDIIQAQIALINNQPDRVLSLLNSAPEDDALKADSVHPNKDGYKIMAERIYSVLQDAGAL